MPSGNVLENPGGEFDEGSTDGNCGGDVAVSRWEAPTTGTFTVVKYGTGEFPSAAIGSGIGGGNNFFAGGCSGSSAGVQTFTFSPAASEDIDAGLVEANLSAYFGGYLGQSDSAEVQVYFLGVDGSNRGNPGADLRVGPVSNTERANESKFVQRTGKASVPAGTRAARVVIVMTRVQGSANDGYVDNVNLSFSERSAPPPASPCPTASAAAPVNEVRVVRLKPAAEFKPAGCKDWVVLTDGTTLKQGDELNVDPDGEVTLEFGDNSTVTIQETTQLKIASFFTEGGIVRTELLLKVGQVAAKVNKTETTRSDFRIKSPSDAASVRGTIFSTFYDPGSRASVTSVREGVVLVTPLRGRGKRVTAGHEVEVTPKGVGKVVGLGRAGAPKGGLNRPAAMARVALLLARADERCGFEVTRYGLRRTPKGWAVTVRLAGRTRGKAGFKVVGKRASPTNRLGRRVARRCP